MRTRELRASLLLLLSTAAFCAEKDALAIDAIIQARHVPYGGIIDPVLSQPDLSQITDYSRCGDSAIWTGHYLAAEAFRYKVTASQDALTNIDNAISAINNLINVTGGDSLSRCALPADSPYAASIASQEAANGIHQGTIFGANWIWVGNTTRDQYVGVFFGLGVAYDMVNDTNVRAWCSFLVTRMLQNLQNHSWNIVLPGGDLTSTFITRPDQQLAMLLIGKHVNGGAFGKGYSALSNAISPTVPIPIAVDCADETASYYKFNLAYDTFYTLKRWGSGYSSFWYDRAYDQLRSTTAWHQNAHFNMIDRAVGSADPYRDSQTATLLDEWLQRSRTDPYRDFHGQFTACSSSEACNPLPVVDRVATDFLWQRDPFQLAGGGYDNIETAGIDYILPYWMARYYGIVTD